MKAHYTRAMEALHRACLFVAGACLVIITIIIPWGVFTRYVLNSAASWPEPMAVLLMIVLSFFSAIVCYREYLHIGVGVLPAFLTGASRTVLGMIIEVCMLATNLFMLWYGVKLRSPPGTRASPNFRSCRSGFPTCRSRSAAPSRRCS